jgi:hypothetical protein
MPGCDGEKGMTDQNGKPRERMFHTNGGEAPAPDSGLALAGGRVHELPARVKKIATTDEGKLQIVLEGEAIRREELEKIRDLFLIQQGRVFVDFTPEQGELDL